MGKYSIEQLGSWDIFFYYGQSDINLEIESELTQLVLQPSRSLYYNNQESGGISNYENYPNEVNLQINARYDIAKGVSWKNGVVTDGSNGYPDRRVAVSQSSISFTRNRGELDVEVFYIPYYDYTNYTTINTLIPGIGK
jgi:hypothetical protein